MNALCAVALHRRTLQTFSDLSLDDCSPLVQMRAASHGCTSTPLASTVDKTALFHQTGGKTEP